MPKKDAPGHKIGAIRMGHVLPSLKGNDVAIYFEHITPKTVDND